MAHYVSGDMRATRDLHCQIYVEPTRAYFRRIVCLPLLIGVNFLR